MLKILKEAYKNPIDMWYFVQGFVRMFLYNNAKFLIREHIQDQYHIRFNAGIECVKKGQCYCGCKTPELFFADKPCYLSTLTEKNRELVAKRKDICYGPMLNKKQFNDLKNDRI